MELPGYYLTPRYLSNSSTSTPYYPSLVIDKTSLKGAVARWKFEGLGYINGNPGIQFDRGYLINNMFPYMFKAQLAKSPERPERLSPEKAEELKRRYASIGEEENNILLISKLKDDPE